MVRRTELDGGAVTPVEVSVVANDGEIGIFLPTKYTGAVIMAATVTKVKNGRALVPVVNAKTVTTTGSGRDTELQDGGGSNGELSAAGPGGIQPAEQQAVTDDEAQPAQDLMRTTAGAAAQQPLAAASLSTGDDEQMTTKNGTDDDVEYDMSERDMRAVHEDRVDGRNERLMVDGDGARHEQEAEVPTSVVGTEAMTATLQTRTRKHRARRSGRSVSRTQPLTRAANKSAEAEQQRVLEMTATRETTSESATDKQYATNELASTEDSTATMAMSPRKEHSATMATCANATLATGSSQRQLGRRVDGGEAANDQRRRGV
ncbi:Gag-pol fusion protein [Phytophthora cinnamomi]|uniref:Gag-pol fusion protein n=1 Tax=Phytophthora cinnamomi TaxID=4785 RepID=UPI00355978C2|nr:Gag-pol fusion protein [Phytophthora cinnamomi]